MSRDLPASALKNIARWVSILAHPFVMIPLLAATATLHAGRGNELALNVGIVALFAILPIAILTIHQVRRGAWANVDASNPRERPILFIVAIASILALIGCLAITQPHSILLRGSEVTLVLLIVCAIITRWIKVSLHLAAAALTATTLLLLKSPIGWGVATILPILAWSRLALGRHTPIELVLGAVLGMIAGIAMRFP